MPLRLKKPPEETSTRPEQWARGPMPAPESRPHYYVRQGLWRLRAARRVAPWLLLAVPAAAIAVAAFEGKTIWHDTFHPGSKPKAEQAQQGKLKPRSSSRASSSSSSSGAAGSAAAGGSSSAGGAQAVSLDTSPLLTRIHALRVQIAALLDGGVTAAERVKLWRLRLRLAVAFRNLVRAELSGNLTAAQRARLEAQLKRLNARIAILRKINRLLRGGITAAERAKLDALVHQFLQLKAQAPLPAVSTLTVAARVTVASTTPAATTTTSAVLGVSTGVTATTAATPTPTAGTATTPGNSEFGHSHKKPKKPKRTAGG